MKIENFKGNAVGSENFKAIAGVKLADSASTGKVIKGNFSPKKTNFFKSLLQNEKKIETDIINFISHFIWFLIKVAAVAVASGALWIVLAHVAPELKELMPHFYSFIEAMLKSFDDPATITKNFSNIF